MADLPTPVARTAERVAPGNDALDGGPLIAPQVFVAEVVSGNGGDLVVEVGHGVEYWPPPCPPHVRGGARPVHPPAPPPVRYLG